MCWYKVCLLQGCTNPGRGGFICETCVNDHCAVQNVEVAFRCWENLWVPGFWNANPLCFWDWNTVRRIDVRPRRGMTSRRFGKRCTYHVQGEWILGCGWGALIWIWLLVTCGKVMSRLVEERLAAVASHQYSKRYYYSYGRPRSLIGVLAVALSRVISIPCVLQM